MHYYGLPSLPPLPSFENHDKMKLKTTDKEKISRIKCEIKGCLNKSHAIVKQMVLCEEHFREEVPETSPSYIKKWNIP